MPAYTAAEIQEPIVQPMGPRTKCAAMTANSRLKNGTRIICTTCGMIFLKNRSKYASVNAASMAGSTCA